MNEDLVQWPRAKYWDKAWNPIIGCHPCSPACDNCYARAWARRFGQGFEPYASSHVKPPRSGVVFCGNLTDLFGEWVPHPGEYVERCHGKAQAIFLWLTKRCSRMAAGALANVWFDHFCRQGNHYFGFTAENQQWFDHRFDDVIQQWPNWANLWVSCEPLLGPINLRPLFPQTFQWVVVGCESGQARRPCKLEWVESIVEQCRAADVPVFVKQLDIDGKCVTDIDRFPAHLRIRQVPWAVEG